MPAMNADNARGWQIIADNLGRQRPYPGRTVTVMRGRKLRGERARVLRHQVDAYVNAFRYGGAGSHHMREIAGRYGYVVLVRADDGREAWVKANYVVCDYNYPHWTIALADAIMFERGH